MDREKVIAQLVAELRENRPQDTEDQIARSAEWIVNNFAATNDGGYLREARPDLFG